jgi:hypothetical protein
VCLKTAVKILQVFENGDMQIRPVSGKPKRYNWRDIWTCEGRGVVHKEDWWEMKKPLLTVSDLAQLDPNERSERTLRRYTEEGRLQRVRLPMDDHRYREFEVSHYLYGASQTGNPRSTR